MEKKVKAISVEKSKVVGTGLGMTLRDLITKVNTKLEEKFNKPIVHIGPDYLNKYDQVTGRESIGKYAIAEMIREVIIEAANEASNATDQETDLTAVVTTSEKSAFWADVEFKMVYKKSGMINSWSHKEDMTIVEIKILPETEAILDKTLFAITADYFAAIEEQEKRHKASYDSRISDFVEFMKSKNLSYEDVKKIIADHSNIATGLSKYFAEVK